MNFKINVALINLNEQINFIDLEIDNQIEKCKNSIDVILKSVSEIKKIVLKSGFKVDTEEIQFFKELKPQFTSKLIYYNVVYVGFYFPLKGEINIGDFNIKEINLKEWRKKCGVIMQDGYIFSGTIVENITFSDSFINEEKISFAIKTAELEETIKKLPMQLNTQIGESGISLSGGEKQRLYIARAIYKDPDFIFFDEATSNLDTINENKIMTNLNEYLNNKTAVIIAHRLSTVKKADNIIVLKNGRIVEQGTHYDLLKNKNEYYNLVENQLDNNL